MKKIKCEKGLLALVLAVFLCTAAWPVGMEGAKAFAANGLVASRDFGHEFPLAWLALNRAARKLNLSEEQRAKMESILSEELPAVRPILKQLAENRRRHAALTRGAAYDEGAAQAYARSQADLIAELIVFKERVRPKLLATLTPAQQEQLQERLLAMEERVRDWMLR